MTEDIIAPVALRKAKRAVVKVGNGRGFVVGTPRARFIITAAHCVPRKRYPHPNLANSVHELTLPWMIGPLGSKRANLPIWSELCHLSLIDDIAVLGAPDNQTLCDEYETFVTHAITVAKSPRAVPPFQWNTTPGAAAFVLSLDGEWQRCTVHNNGRILWISHGADRVKGGMSGSPIINAKGAAIGLISTSDGSGAESTNPSLTDCLPPWLLRKMRGSSHDMKAIHDLILPSSA